MNACAFANIAEYWQSCFVDVEFYGIFVYWDNISRIYILHNISLVVFIEGLDWFAFSIDLNFHKILKD